MVSRTSGLGSVTNNSGGTTNSSTSGSTNTSTSGSSNTSTRGNSSTTTTTNTQNMSSTALAALDSLINSLTTGGIDRGGAFGGKKGGGDQAAQLREEWLAELSANRQIRSDYSKEAAFADAEGATNAAISKALLETMPTVTAGIDAAGTSGSALSALLAQQNAQAAADQAATLSLQAAISYGQIQNNASNTLAELVKSGDPATNALLEALGVAKGSVTKGTTTENTSSSQNSSTNSSQNTTTTGTQNSTQNTGPSTTTTTPTTAVANPSTKVAVGNTTVNTPSSYRSTIYGTAGNYSQFG